MLTSLAFRWILLLALSGPCSILAAPQTPPQNSLTQAPKPKLPRINVGFKYHNYEELTKLLKSIEASFPKITKLYSIGKTSQGRQLWVMLISENPNKEVSMKPHVKYVANMHGNEAVGRELMLHLTAYLVNSYNRSRSSNVNNLLRHTYIHILPTLNPDGFERSVEGQCERGPGRQNAANVDLNRNFPDRFAVNRTESEQRDENEQPETRAMRKWLDDKQFVLSANLHGGALVVNYPFDGSRNRSADHTEATPDQDVFKHLSLVYARKHPRLQYRPECGADQEGSQFEEGVTNGNQWYPITGSMQDYNYIYAGCMELTLELSCCKYPKSTDLPRMWSENKIPLLTLLTEAHMGVKGIVADSTSDQPIAKARLQILGRDVSFRSNARGEYWRLLLPGDYVLLASAPGYKSLQKQFTVTDRVVTVVMVYLAPEGKRQSRTVQRMKAIEQPKEDAYAEQAQKYTSAARVNSLGAIMVLIMALRFFDL